MPSLRGGVDTEGRSTILGGHHQRRNYGDNIIGATDVAQGPDYCAEQCRSTVQLRVADAAADVRLGVSCNRETYAAAICFEPTAKRMCA